MNATNDFVDIHFWQLHRTASNFILRLFEYARVCDLIVNQIRSKREVR